MEANQQRPINHSPNGSTPTDAEPISLEHPETALSVLEADQLVAAKQSSRFGKRKLSFSIKLLFWALRIYVAIMLVIVLVSVLQSLHAGR